MLWSSLSVFLHLAHSFTRPWAIKGVWRAAAAVHNAAQATCIWSSGWFAGDQRHQGMSECAKLFMNLFFSGFFRLLK